MEITWRNLAMDEIIKLAKDDLREPLIEYLGNIDFHVLGVMNEDGKEKIVINLTGYKEHLENKLGVPYTSYYDEDQEMEIYYPLKTFLILPFKKVEDIFKSNGFNVARVESTCLDLEDFSINIRVEVLV